MAEIDKLIEKMVERQVERAVIVNDQPMRLYLGHNEAIGPVIAMVRLHTMVREVTPANLRLNLAQDCKFQFPHQSPHGVFNIAVERKQNLLQVSVASEPKPQPAPANDFFNDSAWPAPVSLPSTPLSTAPPAYVPTPPPYHPIAQPVNSAMTSPAIQAQPAGAVGCLPVVGAMVLCFLGLIVATAVIGDSAPWLTIIATSVWVAFDAQAVGMKKGRLSGWADMAPSSWVAACLLLWIIGFPGYLVARAQVKALNS